MHEGPLVPPGQIYAFMCRCGVRLLASDAVELERLKRQHADLHTGEEPW